MTTAHQTSRMNSTDIRLNYKLEHETLSCLNYPFGDTTWRLLVCQEKEALDMGRETTSLPDIKSKAKVTHS